MSVSSLTLIDLVDTLKQSKFFDLSPVIKSNMPNWNSHPTVTVVSESRTHEKDGYFCQLLVIPEHTGSHCDAPFHVNPQLPERTIDSFPINYLISSGKKVDASNLNLGPGEILELSVFLDLAKKQNVEIQRDDVLIVRFGWEKYLDESKYTKPEDWHWWAGNEPGFSEELCAWISRQGVRAVGTDTAACETAVVDNVTISDYGHKIYFLPNNILTIEGLSGLADLPSEFLFVALPLKIKGGSGSPLRVLGVVPKG